MIPVGAACSAPTYKEHKVNWCNTRRLFDYTIIASIGRQYNGLLVAPISRYCFRDPSMVSDHP